MLVLAAISELGHLVNLPSQAEGVPSTAIPPMLQLTNWLLMGHCFSFLDNAGFSSLNYCVSLALFIPFSSFSASCSSFFLFLYPLIYHNLKSLCTLWLCRISPFTFHLPLPLPEITEPLYHTVLPHLCSFLPNTLCFALYLWDQLQKPMSDVLLPFGILVLPWTCNHLDFDEVPLSWQQPLSILKAPDLHLHNANNILPIPTIRISTISRVCVLVWNKIMG